MIWEVFRQERRGQPFEHAGSFHAPDAAFAETYARQFYARRQESSALWIVPRGEIRELGDLEPAFDPDYRRVDGYSLKARLREARERAGTSEASLAAPPQDARALPARPSPLENLPLASHGRPVEG